MTVIEEIGAIVLQNRRHCNHCAWVDVYALQMAPVSAVTSEMLGQILCGASRNVTADGDLITFKLANGTWVYGLGEYNRVVNGFMLRLLQGPE